MSLVVAASGAGGGLAQSQASTAKDDQDVSLEDAAKHPDASSGGLGERAPEATPAPDRPPTATG